jgi:hypothetical protein
MLPTHKQVPSHLQGHYLLPQTAVLYKQQTDFGNIKHAGEELIT